MNFDPDGVGYDDGFGGRAEAVCGGCGSFFLHEPDEDLGSGPDAPLCRPCRSDGGDGPDSGDDEPDADDAGPDRGDAS